MTSDDACMLDRQTIMLRIHFENSLKNAQLKLSSSFRSSNVNVAVTRLDALGESYSTQLFFSCMWSGNHDTFMNIVHGHHCLLQVHCSCMMEQSLEDLACEWDVLSNL